MGVVVDKFDLFTLVSIHEATIEKKEIGTGDIARSFFKVDSKMDNNRFMTEKMNFVKARLDKMEREGIVFVVKDLTGRKKYKLDNSKIVLKRFKFPDNKVKESICIKDKENKWNIYQL